MSLLLKAHSPVSSGVMHAISVPYVLHPQRMKHSHLTVALGQCYKLSVLGALRPTRFQPLTGHKCPLHSPWIVVLRDINPSHGPNKVVFTNLFDSILLGIGFLFLPGACW